MECYEVSIQKAVNGFIVKVGCKTFVAPSWELVSDQLGRYFKDPEGTEKAYAERYGWNKAVPAPEGAEVPW